MDMMVYFLLTLSLILHLIMIFAIIVLFQRRSLERVNLPTLQEDVETIHESIEAFINEVEQENERLYEQMQTSFKRQADEWNKQASALQEYIRQLDERILILEQRSSVDSSEGTAPDQENPFPAQSATPHIAATVAADVAANPPSQISGQAHHKQVGMDEQQQKFQRVVELYKQGFSIDDIAKLLNIGKGEAMLLVNLLDKQK
jgi:hypothetical protein